MPEAGPDLSQLAAAQESSTPNTEISPAQAANILAPALVEVTQQHRGLRGRNRYGRYNDYGSRAQINLQGEDGDIILMVGTREPKLHLPTKTATTLMREMRPNPVPNGLYLITDRKASKVARSAEDIATLLYQLEDQGLDSREVATQVLVTLQREGYIFSTSLSDHITQLGISGFFNNSSDIPTLTKIEGDGINSQTMGAERTSHGTELIYDPNNTQAFMEGLKSAVSASGLPTRASWEFGIVPPNYHRGKLKLDETSAPLEIVIGPSERSIVVPITADGQVVLAHSSIPILEGREENPTRLLALTADVIPGQTPQQTAEQVLGNMSFPGTVQIQESGGMYQWKYLNTHVTSNLAKLTATSTELQVSQSGIETLTEQQFYRLIDDGIITDLPTIVAVQFAFAARRGEYDNADPFPGEQAELNAVLAKLNDPTILRSGIVYDSVDSPDDYFPRESSARGHEYINNRDNQAQMLLVVNRPGEEARILFINEPDFAHGEHGKKHLKLPGGAIDRTGAPKKNKFNGLFADRPQLVEGSETAQHESSEEAGYHADPNSVRALTPPRYPDSGMTVSSQVFQGDLDYIGEPKGGDEREVEKGQPIEIPVSQIGWYIRHGYITDASVIAGLLDWGRKNGIDFFKR